MLGSGTRLGRIAANTARWQSTTAGKSRATRSWRLRGTYIFPILLFSAVSSLAINVRNAKDDARLLEDKHAAQLSVLRDLMARLLAGENLSQQQLLKEYERVGIIQRQDASELKPSKTITWRETLFGRKKEERDLEAERQELVDIEHILNQAAETSPTALVVPKKQPQGLKEAVPESVTNPTSSVKEVKSINKEKPTARVLI